MSTSTDYSSFTFENISDSVTTGDRVVYTAGIEASRDYHNPDSVNSVKRKHPTIKLLVSVFGVPYLPVELLSTDMARIIQSVSWVKSRSTPGGSLQVTLAGDRRALAQWDVIQTIKDVLGLTRPLDFSDIFKPRSLCQYWKDGYHVMTGYVKSCKRRASVSGNSAEVSYTVEIDELGNLYQESITSINTILMGLDKHVFDDMTKIFAQLARTVTMSAPQAIKNIVEAFKISTLSSFTVMSDALPLAFRLVAEGPPLGAIAAFSLITTVIAESGLFALSGGTTLWDYLKSHVPGPFMELYTESGGRTIVTQNGTPSVLFPGFNYIVARTCPYDNPILGMTPHLWIYRYTLGVLQLLGGGDFIIVTDDDVISKDLGTSDDQQYTIFSVSYDGKGATDAPSIHNRPSIAIGPQNPLASGGIKTFGQRELNTAMSTVSMSGTGLAGQLIQETQKKLSGMSGVIGVPVLASLLNVWFRNASKFREGTITTRSIPYARPGMVLLYLPTKRGVVECDLDIGIYYIDNIADEYTIGETDKTTFTVIRGTPLPINPATVLSVMADWEIMPPGMGYYDGEVLTKLAASMGGMI